MTGSPTYRPVTADDADFMVELFLALNRQAKPGQELDVEAITAGTRAATLEQAQGKVEDSITYVIERGAASIGRLRVVRADRFLEIAGLQIHPAHQNNGAGTAVISALVREAESRNVPTVLGVDKDNPNARRLYLRLGFTDAAETDSQYRMELAPTSAPVEEVLAGGNLNPVVRVGRTVRRAPGAWTPAVHELLRHLEAHRFEGAPRVLGFDDQGREVLTLIEGMTDSSGDPAWVWFDSALLEAGRLIRRYHDLCRTFRPASEASWQVMVGAPTTGEVICHNDLAPFNAVYRQGVPMAFFDWDLAAPGPPLWDIAYAAWRFVPLYCDSSDRGWPVDVAVRAARLRLFCDAYGLHSTERVRLVAMIERRIRCAYETGKAWGEAGKPGWSQLWQEETHGNGTLRDLAYVSEHRDTFSRALV